MPMTRTLLTRYPSSSYCRILGSVIFLIGTVLVPAGLVGCGPYDMQQTTAQEAYVHYCSSCHGIDGKGNGPLADDLKRPPSDLTQLAARPGGFDERALLAVVVGTREIDAHGPSDMPVWGAVFEEELRTDRMRYAGYTALLKAQALVDYLLSIQEK